MTLSPKKFAQSYLPWDSRSADKCDGMWQAISWHRVCHSNLGQIGHSLPIMRQLSSTDNKIICKAFREWPTCTWLWWFSNRLWFHICSCSRHLNIVSNLSQSGVDVECFLLPFLLFPCWLDHGLCTSQDLPLFQVNTNDSLFAGDLLRNNNIKPWWCISSKTVQGDILLGSIVCKLEHL